MKKALMIILIVLITIFTQVSCQAQQGASITPQELLQETLGTQETLTPQESTQETPGTQETFTLKQIATNTWRMRTVTDENIYLVIGEKVAALIDTGIGSFDLKSVVKSITELPIIVINTHGHTDHTGGNAQFDIAYMSHADYDIFLSRSGGTLKNPLPADEGQIFDLGGRKLEVVETPGHTQGSIILIDAENKLVFTGDTVNPGGEWMWLDESTSIEAYDNSLKKILNCLQDDYAVWAGHETLCY